MIELKDKATGKPIGTITDEQLQFLIDQLEEESPTDQDYYINKPTLQDFMEADADPELLDMLRRAMGDREDMEIEWAQQ